MIFKYYIVSLNDGIANGTDDDSVADDFSQSDEYCVIDSTNGKILQANECPVCISAMFQAAK